MSENQHRAPAPAAASSAIRTELYDAATGMRGFVVVDKLIDGRAMGGLRIAPNVSIDEVSALAHRMGLKLALAGVAIGASKGGIMVAADASDELRTKQLAAFGRLAGPLFRGGVYLGTDLGCSYRDRAFIYSAANYSVESQAPSLPCSWAELWRHCRDVTGLGTAHACEVIANELGLTTAQRRVVIQGFGEVGKAVARHGAQLGLKVVAVADKHGTVVASSSSPAGQPAELPIDELIAITDELGNIDQSRLPTGVTLRTDPEAWLDVDTDLLVLAATGHAVTARNVDRVRARVIVEGANMPTSEDAIAHLTDSGRLVVPDIIANPGGAIGCGLALRGDIPAGKTAEEGAQWLFDETAKRIRPNASSAYRQSLADGRTMHAVGLEMAENRAQELHGR